VNYERNKKGARFFETVYMHMPYDIIFFQFFELDRLNSIVVVVVRRVLRPVGYWVIQCKKNQTNLASFHNFVPVI